MKTETIDVETTPEAKDPETGALVRVDQNRAVGKAMSVEELHRHLEHIREIMRKEMKEGQDYGKIPGTGDRKTLLQPGAQKLLMTFNLTEEVKKEVLREYPGMHREYEFIITVRAGNGKAWDGVGTCSTLESKYRYRKAERTCPSCGATTIIEGKAEYGGGFVCFKKKGGCGAKFVITDERIASQPGGVVENEDPADTWNTVRKMAFKRGLVAAAINATNTSELWTQDMEELSQNEAIQKEKARQNAPGRSGGYQRSTPPPQSSAQVAKPEKPTAQEKPAPPEKPRFASEKTLAWMIKELSAQRDSAILYFQALTSPDVLLPNETLEDVPLPFVPTSNAQMAALKLAINHFLAGKEAKHAFRNDISTPIFDSSEKLSDPPKEKPTVPPSVAAAAKKDPEWFWDVFISVPRKGSKKSEYDANPDTIGSLYDEMKAGDKAAQSRLWGLARHWNPEPREYNGKTYPPSEGDHATRAALDAFVEWEEKHGKDTLKEPPPADRAEGPEPEGFNPTDYDVPM